MDALRDFHSGIVQTFTSFQTSNKKKEYLIESEKEISQDKNNLYVKFK